MNRSTNPPIGIFDSGIGGTSILSEITTFLPNEDTIYLSDSANAPYGQRSPKEILALSIKNTEYLLDRGSKIIVVACNTATTNAIKTLRNSYKVPFIGIEPAIKPAALKTATNVIGILATKGTLNSQLFEQTSNTINDSIKIIEQVGEGLVELIEKGKINSKEMTVLLEKYLHNMLKQNADCIVLGCTHYPYLIPQIRRIVGSDIHIIDSGEAVARQTKRILSQNDLLNKTVTRPSIHSILINSDSNALRTIVGNKQDYTISQVAF